MQNVILANSKNMTMSSREIAELTGKRHDHVMVDIAKMLDALNGGAAPCNELGIPIFGDTYINEQNGQKYNIFNLPKRETLILVSGYSVKMRATIIDRWQELETKSQHLIPQTLSEALRLAADLSDQRNEALAQLAIVEPKANALDRISTADGSLCLTDAAKELQMRPKDFISWMSCNQWIYKRAGSSNWIGYQDRIQSGLLEHKSNIVIDADGRERVRDQVRVTGKGLARLAQVIESEAA